MKNKKIFVACDSTNISRIKDIIKKTQNSKIKIGYKFGLEFLNSKHGRAFVSNLKNKIVFADLKLHDIPNTCVSTIKAVKDLKLAFEKKSEFHSLERIGISKVEQILLNPCIS